MISHLSLTRWDVGRNAQNLKSFHNRNEVSAIVIVFASLCSKIW